MASVAFSAEYVLPIRKLEVNSKARPTGKGTTPWSWRAVADAASGIAFFGLLGWEVWRIGGLLFQVAAQMLAAGGGYLF